jgi:TolB protein
MKNTITWALMSLFLLVSWDSSSAQSSGAVAPKRVTNIVNSYPYPSPDGQHIVFQSNRTGRWEIFVVGIDGSDPRQLTDSPGDNVTPVWSPDGKQIVFAATPGGNSDIYLMNADGQNRKRLTQHPGDDSHPHWSSDGSRIVFNSPRTTPDLSVGWSDQWHEIYTMTADGSDIQQHTNNKTVCTFPTLSPDGTRIAFRKVIEAPAFGWDLTLGNRNSEIFVADIDGSNQVNISNNAAFDGWPRWSPDGTQIVFASNRTGPAMACQLFVVNVDGSALRQISEGDWSNAQPAWSFDSKRIYAYHFQETVSFEFGDIAVFDLSN